MGQVSRARPLHDLPADPLAGAAGYDAGGQVARLQTEIAQRLSAPVADLRHGSSDRSAERLVRRLSVGAGYGALLAGYAGIAAAVLFLI